MPVTTTSAVRQLSDGNPIGNTLGQSATDIISFFGVAPVVQPAAPASHSVTTTAAGSTTAVFVNTTFAGTTGASAYTIGDVVTALKALGLLAL